MSEEKINKVKHAYENILLVNELLIVSYYAFFEAMADTILDRRSK